MSSVPRVVWMGPVAASQVHASPSDLFIQCVGAAGTPICEDMANATGLEQLLLSKGVPATQPVVLRGFSAGGDAIKKFLQDHADRDRVLAVVLSDATYQQHGSDEGFIAYGTEAAQSLPGRIFVATASGGGSSRGISDSESMDALRQQIEARTGQRFQEISVPWAPKPPVKAWLLGHTMLLDFGTAYSHGEHATVLATPVWDNVVQPWLDESQGPSGSGEDEGEGGEGQGGVSSYGTAVALGAIGVGAIGIALALGRKSNEAMATTTRREGKPRSARNVRHDPTGVLDFVFGGPVLPRVGDSISGWKLTKELGRGGFGVVYKAEYGDKAIAIKFLIPPFDDATLKAFRDEAKIAKRVGSGTIRVLAQGEHNGAPYYAMPLLHGEDLSAYLQQRGGKLEPEEAVAITEPILRTLSKAHRRGVVHKDIKPNNIYLDRGKPILLDWGLAKAPGVKEMVGAGTPHYMPPEQYVSKVRPSADVYAMGATEYKLVSGRTPPEECPVPPVELVAKNIPPRLARVIDKAMSCRPEDRYRTAGAMLRAMRPAVRESMQAHMIAKPKHSLVGAVAVATIVVGTALGAAYATRTP